MFLKSLERTRTKSAKVFERKEMNHKSFTRDEWYLFKLLILLLITMVYEKKNSFYFHYYKRRGKKWIYTCTNNCINIRVCLHGAIIITWCFGFFSLFSLSIPGNNLKHARSNHHTGLNTDYRFLKTPYGRQHNGSKKGHCDSKSIQVHFLKTLLLIVQKLY